MLRGSLGAKKLNEAFLEYIIKVHKEKKENAIQLLIGTGERYFEDIKKELVKHGLDINKQNNIKIVPYVYDMANTMAASDIVVSRAGAITVSEITACGKPAILIPSPNVTNNHQEYNAGALEKKGAAIVINENNLSGEVLYEKIEYLLNNKNVLEKMSRNSLNLGKIDASKKIFDIILEQNKAV